MKKILLFLVLPLLMQSCLFQDDDKFDKSASERLDEKITEAQAAFESSSTGWVLHYFPDLQYGGYNYWYSFSNDGIATAACETSTVSTYTETCMYDVIAEQGAILTFNTYSELVHQFRNPSQAAYEGKLGDYEFVIRNVSADEIRVIGKTTGNSMRFFKLPNGYTYDTYMDAVKAMEEIGKSGNYEVYYKGTKIGETVGTQSGRSLSLETTNDAGEIIQTNIPLVFTPDGFTIYHSNLRPYSKYFLVSSVEEDPYYTDFTYNATDKKFVSADGDLEFVKIFQPINQILAKTPLQWFFDATDASYSSPAFTSIWNSVAAINSSGLGETLQYVIIGANPFSSASSIPQVLAINSFDGTTAWWAGYGISISPVANTTDQVNIVNVGGDALNWSYYTHCMPLFDFFFDNSPWKLTADDPEDPSQIKFESVANSSIWMIAEP